MPALIAYDLHVAWAWFIIVTNGLAGLWALAASRFPVLRVRPLWWFTGVAQVAVFLQVLLGFYLVAGEDLVAPEFHIFYGVLGLITVAIIYGYRHQLRHRLYTLYGLGGLFLMGLGIRAFLLA